MKRSFSICLILVCLSFGIARGNGIVLSNITSVNGAGFVQLQFDLSWNNSWNNAINRDAAWVFFKFKDNDGTWHHLNLTNANNSISAGYSLTVPSDLTGAMISRSSVGSGTVTLTGVQVGVNNLPGSFDVKGFAIEMVRIPVETPFYLGDAAGGEAYRTFNTSAPYFVNIDSFFMGSTTGYLIDFYQPAGTILLGPRFPIGYSSNLTLSSYMMKHEISQSAYRDFLNCLTYTQQQRRTALSPASAMGTEVLHASALTYRNGIAIATPGIASTTPAVYGCDLNNNMAFNEATDGEWIACGYLNYMDVAAFLDWAAMRPMTELEFEKSCRGGLNAVMGENATGTLAFATSWTLNNTGATNEAATYTGSIFNANITHSVTAPNNTSPLRVGIHATANATRISAGAGYYGCLDLSGNIGEIAVTTANAAGCSFTGVNGNGNLNAAGDADVNYWPGINGNNTATTPNAPYGGSTGVVVAIGTILRGGGCLNPPVYTMVSGRALNVNMEIRQLQNGGRGVKSF